MADNRKEVKLPSGATLKITIAKFEDARALYQAILDEGKSILIGAKTEMAEVYKNLFCIGFSSKKIEACLWECFKKCTYNSGAGDLKIDESTFEPVSARNDYLSVCMEVAKENINPFVKSLSVEYGHVIKMMLTDLT